jgi:excinuclease UvrABC ATPase subunit
MIKQTDLKNYLSYDKDTGEFIALQGSLRHPVGRKLGTLHSTGYVVIRIQGKLYKAHRLAWLYETGKFPDGVIDHINRNKSDNRFSNLREIEITHNAENNPIKKSNSSGFPGVSFSKKMKCWRARITYNYKEKHLGYFESAEDAFKAYQFAATKYHMYNPNALKI